MYNGEIMSVIPYPSSQSKTLAGQLLVALLIALILAPIAGVLFVGSYQLYYSGRIYPGVSVAGIDLSGLSPAEAAARIDTALVYPRTGTILMKDGDRIWSAHPGQLGFFFDPETSAMQALQVGRQGNLAHRLYEQAGAYWNGASLPPVMVFDQRTAQQFLVNISKDVNRQAVEAVLGLNGAAVEVNSGQIGRSLDIPSSLALLDHQIRSLQDGVIPLVIKETPPVILDATEQAELARTILSQPLVLSLPEGQTGPGPWTIQPSDLAGMLVIERVQNEQGGRYQVAVNSDLLRAYLASLAPSLYKAPDNARFIFNDDTRKLEVIQNAVLGRTLDIEASVQVINQKLGQGEHNIALQFQVDKPAVTDDMTAEQLGITELVSAQTTYFYGSSASRVQNIRTAASRFHGLLVPPGATFSMAQALGDISLDNGYAEALIILGDQTIAGVGGGVCQVSTTLFRTVFYAGLPVNERHEHAYRVSYYEQKANGAVDPNLAGLDATVFVPLVDFKFTNDTSNWLLMETYLNGYALTWKFYSTSDGRTVSMDTTGPTNKVEPPDPIYKENPELEKGKIKQVDWAAEGADITITRTVMRGGSIYLQDAFRTHYQAWSAKYEYGPGTEDIPTPDPTEEN